MEDKETSVTGVLMEVAGIESCGLGIGPMEIPAKDKDDE